ncbi:hypothetical protein B0H14DRAFT_2944581, partial [Mycena olivaceomarginata]
HIFVLFPSSSADLLLLTPFIPTFALFSSHCSLSRAQLLSPFGPSISQCPFVPYICTASLTNSDEIQQLSIPIAIKSSS